MLVSSCEVECMAMIHNPSGGFVLEKFSAVVFLICLSGGSQYLHRLVAYMVGKKKKEIIYFPKCCLSTI